MNKGIVFIWLAILFCWSGVPCHAQLEADNWMFGYDYYVNFNKGSIPDTVRYPTTISGLEIGRGTTSYSDRNGNLQFYAGSWGIVYDRNFQRFPSTDVPTGIQLFGADNEVVSQPILAIPYPGHDSLFIIFHIRVQFTTQYISSLYYSVLNMKLRNGLGEIVPGQKNIPLLGGAEVGYKLTAVLHCNKKDIWVVGHLIESDKYFSYLITENGVTANPVYFPGTFIPKRRVSATYFDDKVNNNGCIKASALGNRLAAAFMGMGFVELFDFDIQTGIGNGLKILNTDPPAADTAIYVFSFVGVGPLGIDFSPSGDKLYTTSNYDLRQSTDYYYAAYIHQFNASLPTQMQIQNSRYRIDSINGLRGGAIQIGNNGKMYININDHLYEISNPEAAGALCNYNGRKVFSGQQYSNLNLPTYLQSYFRYPIIATGNCQFQNISFSIQNLTGVSTILWDFGDPASGVNNSSPSFTPTHIYSTQGVYYVKAILQNANGCGADTIRKVVYTGPFQVNLGNDVTICAGDTLRLRMNIPNASNLWNTGSRDTVIHVTQAGTYWVRTNIGECVASDTINVSVRGLPVFSLGNDQAICSDQAANLSPTPAPSNVTYLWNTGVTTASINTSSDGLYWLQAEENGSGCRYRDSVSIAFKTLPNYSLGPDASICEKDTVLLNAGVAGAASYLWSTGAVSPSIKVYQNGIYWADVSKDGCTYRDSITVAVKPLPVVYLGQDTTLCEDKTLILGAYIAGAQYQWQDNSNSQTFTVNKPGRYFVKVVRDGCISKDTINVSYEYKPIFSLGKDTVICDGQTIVLQPRVQNNNGVTYLWNNGLTSPVFSVTQPGFYSLEVSNNCGLKTDEIVVTKGACKIYIPSGFTPNNDGKNDIFKASFGENVTSFSMSIFNRWGQNIFNSNNIARGWDGKFNEIVQPQDSYVWVIKYRVLNDDKEYLQKGIVNLIR